MRTVNILLAATLGLAGGTAGTWLALHRTATSTSAPTTRDKSVLYWYDPMVPDQHFDKPGKSPFMGMQLVPKYAGGGTDAAGVVQIDPREVQNLGVRTAQAERGTLAASLHANGAVAFDERAVSVVQSRVPGIVERLEVRAPFTPVTRGQPLLTVLAPDWTAAQAEYLALLRARTGGLDKLQSAARQRLELLGMSEAEVRAVERSGRAQTRITLVSPRDGVVTELGVRDGNTVIAGTPLMRVNGLNDVWVNAAIPEAMRSRVAPGAAAKVQVPAFPGATFDGRIEALLPDVDATTRTQVARIVVENPQHRLAPGMYASIDIAAIHSQTESVLIPTEAVIATGTRSVVIVADGPGRFRSQEVRLGDESGGKTQILDGIEAGDAVVLSGQFLIDSEASLSGTLVRLQGNATAASTRKSSNEMPAAEKMHLAQGTVKRIAGNEWTIAADAIPSLGMGAMTMQFMRPQSVPVDDIRVGDRVSFSFLRNAGGDFEIARIAVIGPEAAQKPAGANP